MAISNPLSPRLIFNEINGTSHASGATIGSGVTMSSLRSASIAYNSVKSAPDAMSEWNGYTHTQSFGTPTYYVDNTTSTNVGTQMANYCVTNATTHEEYESTAVCNTTFYYKINSADEDNLMMEWYMDPDHTVRYVPTSYDFLSRTVSARNTSGGVASFTGNFSSGFTPMKIAQLNVGPLGEATSLQARIYASVIDGTGTYAASVSGYIITSGWVEIVNSSGALTTASNAKNGISPAAWTLPQGDNSTATHAPYHKIVCEIKATGYNQQALNYFISHHSATAISNESL